VRILLLGANGQLGRTFLDHGGLAARGELTVATRDGALTHGGHGETADLSIPESLPVLLDRVRPEVIVNAAAYTAVDRAEQEEALATRVNGEAVGALGRWAAAHGALVIHYSTDYVFDGSQSQPYAVDAPTGPLGAYGRSKLAGEQAVFQILPETGFVVRTAWLYGEHGKNFVATILNAARQREFLDVVDDQRGQPTWARALAAQLIALGGAALAGQAPAGAYHGTCSGETTWYGLARAAFELSGLDPDRVRPTSSDKFPRPAARPSYSVLGHERWAAAGLPPLPDWHLSLAEFLLGTSF